MSSSFPAPFRVFSPFSSTTVIVPRAGARPLRVETVKPRAALPKTGQFGLSAEPRPAAQKISVHVPAPPPASVLYVPTPKGLVRSEAYEDWLDQAARRLNAQKPGRIGATFALEVIAPRTARTRQFGALERPLVELLARCRIVRRGLSPEKFCATYGAGSELTLTISDFSAA
ncbi:MAG TPA: hypothetical protein VMU18_08890 [Rhodoblastus sp.]|nr:hypothetical protein [Rhodoblastus sp.]